MAQSKLFILGWILFILSAMVLISVHVEDGRIAGISWMLLLEHLLFFACMLFICTMLILVQQVHHPKDLDDTNNE